MFDKNGSKSIGMNENEINKPTPYSRSSGEAVQQKTMNLRNRKKQLAAYITIHKRWVLIILTIMAGSMAIWYQSDNDKEGIKEAGSAKNMESKDKSQDPLKAAAKYNTGIRDINRDSIVRTPDSAYRIPSPKIK